MSFRILHIRADSDASNPIEGAARMIRSYMSNTEGAGVENYLLLIGAQSDHDVAFQDIPVERKFIINNFSSRNFIDKKFWGKIVHYISEKQIHILQSHSYKADLIAVVLKFITKLPIVSTVHGYNPASNRLKSKLLWQIYRNLWYFFDHIIVVAPAMLQIPIFKRLNTAGKVTVVRNFIHEFPRVTRKTPETGAPFELLCVGRLSAEKNQILLCKAINELHGKRDLHCTLVGDGPQRSFIEQYLSENRLEQQISIAGFQADILPFYLKADALVVPSLYEGLPLVLLEAMSVKCPVIAVDIGEIHTLLKDGAGLLFPRNNLSSLVEKISYAMDHPQEQCLMAERAYEIYRRTFDPAESARALASVYQKV